MPFENSAGTNVYNQYGPRFVGDDNVGVFKTEGMYNELMIDFDAAYLNDVIANGGSRALDLTKIYGTTLVTEVILHVVDPIITDAADKDFYVGTEGSETTNGAVFADTLIDDAGIYVVEKASLTGTWAAELASATQIGFAFESGVTSVTSGSGRIVVKYIKVD